MRDVDKINRQVFYFTAPKLDPEATYPKGNNNFQYFRAPEGYCFIIVSMEMSVGESQSLNQGIIEISDGHYYTGWDIYPGVENRETLTRMSFNNYQGYHNVSLNNWECKEITIATRALTATYAFKGCVIIWYFLKKMSKLETLFYALAHPRYRRWKKAFASTVEPTEE